jgi:hypothetical protein
MSPTQPSPRGGTLASDTTSPGDKAAELRRKAEAAARDPEDWVKENRRRAAGSFVIGKTETHRETERQRDRETEGQRAKDRETERQIEIDRERETERQRARQERTARHQCTRAHLMMKLICVTRHL